MDANGQRFWLLADAPHWALGDGADYDEPCRRLRLRSERDRALPADPIDAQGTARGALDVMPQARDGYGTRSVWDATNGVLAAVSVLPGAVGTWTPPTPDAPTDVAVGRDGILYAAHGGALVLHDLRGRWGDVSIGADVAAFRAWRIAPDPNGGVWVLDHLSQQLAHAHGAPLPDGPLAPYSPCTARPCAENPDPPTMRVLTRAQWVGSEAVGLAVAPNGRLAILGWRPAANARLHLQAADGSLSLAVDLAGVRWPYTLAWLGDDTVAVRVPGLAREALVFELGDAIAAAEQHPTAAPVAAKPAGGVWPLRDAAVGPFAHGLDLPPWYPTAPSADLPGLPGSAPLHRLSSPSFATWGRAASARGLDSGSAETVWHRLYLEARIPPRCGARLWLAATNDATAPADSDHDAWHEHRLGDPPISASGYAVPRAAWVNLPSELPFHDGMLGATPREPDRSGLFTVLIQRATRPSRALRGRYLHVRVKLLGDRRNTPEIAAIRAYGSRFSYVERYLPELYQEQLPGASRDVVLTRDGLPDDVAPQSTPADFLERFVANFEGVFTAIEDRIAGAYLLTDPRTAPEASLDWLGTWIGVTLDPAYPGPRRRRLLAQAPQLYRERGTLAGLRRALDLATDGGCRDGRLVVVENWRLRRTMATILGADLADEMDPLLAGLTVSGNSVVGDTLITGDVPRDELAALFAPAGPPDSAAEEAVREFYDQFANRVTILVHDSVASTDLALVRRVAELETPAHVAVEVVTAGAPFLAGIASLVGVDTYLGPPQGPQPVDLDRSTLGSDYLIGPASLDPRLASRSAPLLGTGGAKPAARMVAPDSVDIGERFVLDGGESTAAEGRRLTRFAWRRLS